MLVLTADRPEELRGVGAPQTIDQIDLYGASVRWFHDAGVADDAERSLWRDLAHDAWMNAVSTGRGPVHLNLPFREPLLGRAAALPEPTARPHAVRRRVAFDRPGTRRGVDAERGVIVAGGRSGVARPTSLRSPRHRMAGPRRPDVGDASDRRRRRVRRLLLRDPGFAAKHRPDVVVRLGPPASKVLAQWIGVDRRATSSRSADPASIDPDRNVRPSCSMRRRPRWRAVGPGRGATGWTEAWSMADALAEYARSRQALAGEAELTEPGVARTIAAVLPDGAELAVASSMPVRDLEWFGGPAGGGRTPTAAPTGSTASCRRRSACALAGADRRWCCSATSPSCHDATRSRPCAAADVDLRDRRGRQRRRRHLLVPAAGHRRSRPTRFEQLFGTPHGTDLVALAAAHGISSRDGRRRRTS